MAIRKGLSTGLKDDGPHMQRFAVEPQEFLKELFAAAVAAVQADRVMASFLPPPPPAGNLVVVGAGKAAAAMARAVETHYANDVALSGLVLVPDGYALPCGRIAVMEAAHPVPDSRGVVGARRILAMASAAKAEDLVLCLLSGGASALMVLPAAGIVLEEKQSITRELLASGAGIQEMNCVRKHLSDIKGGKLAAAVSEAHTATILISDVVGDDPAVIGSGPTVPDPFTCAEALAVLQKYEIKVPPHIVALLRDGGLETPKHLPKNASLKIAARPKDALAAAEEKVRAAGLHVINLGDACEGEAKTVALEHARLALAVREGRNTVKPPCVILSGGELVVTHRDGGRGGPNTEYALALAAALDGRPGVWGLAADTDGRDGNSGAAGAMFGPSTLHKATARGLDQANALSRHDSARFFEGVDGLLQTGPTYTNVNDFRAILILPQD